MCNKKTMWKPIPALSNGHHGFTTLFLQKSGVCKVANNDVSLKQHKDIVTMVREMLTVEF